MSDPAVLIERDGAVLTITLNRPEKRNAFNAEVLCRLCDAWDLLDADGELRVGILTGADGNFSAGSLITGGPYTVTANASGYEGQTVNDVITAPEAPTVYLSRHAGANRPERAGAALRRTHDADAGEQPECEDERAGAK